MAPGDLCVAPGPAHSQSSTTHFLGKLVPLTTESALLSCGPRGTASSLCRPLHSVGRKGPPGKCWSASVRGETLPPVLRGCSPAVPGTASPRLGPSCEGPPLSGASPPLVSQLGWETKQVFLFPSGGRQIVDVENHICIPISTTAVGLREGPPTDPISPCPPRRCKRLTHPKHRPALAIFISGAAAENTSSMGPELGRRVRCQCDVPGDFFSSSGRPTH